MKDQTHFERRRIGLCSSKSAWQHRQRHLSLILMSMQIRCPDNRFLGALHLEVQRRWLYCRKSLLQRRIYHVLDSKDVQQWGCSPLSLVEGPVGAPCRRLFLEARQ